MEGHGKKNAVNIICKDIIVQWDKPWVACLGQGQQIYGLSPLSSLRMAKDIDTGGCSSEAS